MAVKLRRRCQKIGPSTGKKKISSVSHFPQPSPKKSILWKGVLKHHFDRPAPLNKATFAEKYTAEDVLILGHPSDFDSQCHEDHFCKGNLGSPSGSFVGEGSRTGNNKENTAKLSFLGKEYINITNFSTCIQAFHRKKY